MFNSTSIDKAGALANDKVAFFIWGVTNSGKSTFIDKCMKFCPGFFGPCEVGKEFRWRYPPGHFEGQGAPEHTEDEAMEILEMLIQKNREKQFLLIDGQPRTVSQVNRVMSLTDNKYGYQPVLIWFHASIEELEHRLENRFPLESGMTEEEELEAIKWRELSRDRLNNDRIHLYDVLWRVVESSQIPILIVSSEELRSDEDYIRVMLDICCRTLS